MTSWSSHSRRRQDFARRLAPTSVADALLKLTDLGLAGVIFVAPLFLGGRHDFGRFVLVAFIALAAASWFARQAVVGQGTWARRRVNWLLLGVATMLLVQLTPLSPGWIEQLSPRTAALLPLWAGPTDPGELGQWQTLSLAPDAARQSLAMLAAYALLFITVSHRLESRDDVMRLLRWIGLSAASVALLGLLQAAAPNGKFLWIYDHPTETTFDRLSGPFANRNHFAHFLVLGAAALAAWSMSASRLANPQRPARRNTSRSVLQMTIFDRPTLPLGLLVLVALTVIMTGSRGGAIALLVAAITFAGLMWRAGYLKANRLGLLAAGAAAVLLAAPLFGFDGAVKRISSLTAHSIDQLDEHGARRRIWAANIEAIKAGGWFGAGAGSHRDIYPIYMVDPPVKEHTHAESGYLQVATENGVLGAALLTIALAACIFWCRKGLLHADSAQAYAAAAACTAALAASAVHSIFDFVWYIPGCLAITLIIAACILRLGELAKPSPAATRTYSLRLVGSVNVAAAITLIAAFSVGELFGLAMASIHWDAYHRTSNAQRELAHDLLAMRPEESAQAREASHAATSAALESMIRELQQAVSWRPRFAAAHRQLANRYLELYHLRAEQSDNPMPAPQVREAAIASQFRSAADLNAWLATAFGENSRLLYPALHHARIAARLAPLQGSPYVRLAALGFLHGQGHAATDAYLNQALLVRPHDGDLLFEVGADLCVREQVEAGLDCWTRAFRLRGEHRLKVARAVAGAMPFANLLELFQPQWDTLPQFWAVYRRADDANIAAFMNYAHAQTMREAASAGRAKAAVLWRRLAQVQLEASMQDACLASLHNSHTACPDDYSTRRMLGMVLVDAGRPDEAAPHLRWCQARQPHDARVADVLTQITRHRLAGDPDKTPATK